MRKLCPEGLSEMGTRARPEAQSFPSVPKPWLLRRNFSPGQAQINMSTRNPPEQRLMTRGRLRVLRFSARRLCTGCSSCAYRSLTHWSSLLQRRAGVGPHLTIRTGTSHGIVPVTSFCLVTTVSGSSTIFVAVTTMPSFRPHASVSVPSTINFCPFGISNS